MKAVILAGGYGTRISEESHLKPKPMIEIGGKPILWHIMKIYASYGINDFIICCGYKAEIIKEYFSSFDSGEWNIQLVDTGLEIFLSPFKPLSCENSGVPVKALLAKY